MTYKIAWMFPDILFIHGERGNVLAVERFAKMAGYDVQVDRIYMDTEFDPCDYDTILFGVGELSSFETLIEWLRPRSEAFQKYIRSGRPMMVTGTSQAIFANTIKRADGSEFKGLGFIPADIVENEAVYGDDVLFACTYNGKEMEINGSQIMMMDIIHNDTVESDASVWGTMMYGYGNSGRDRAEGYVQNNAIFTNGLGPMLVCNPWLTVEMIKAAAAYRGDKINDIDETFELERTSFDRKKNYNLNKATRLTNCK